MDMSVADAWMCGYLADDDVVRLILADLYSLTDFQCDVARESSWYELEGDKALADWLWHRSGPVVLAVLESVR